MDSGCSLVNIETGCNIGSLPNGATTTITLTATIDAAGAFDNGVAVTATEDDPAPGNNSDPNGNGGVATDPSLTIVKTQTGGDNPVSTPGSLGYEIVVTNDGIGDLTNVIVTDTLPDGSAGSVGAPTESISTDGILEPGETFTYSISYSVTQADIDAGVTLINSASVVTDELPTPETDTAETTVTQVASLTVTKNRTGITGVGGDGDTVTYDIIVTNTGDTTVSNIEVTDANAVVSGSPITSLAVGASTTLTAVQTITSTDVANGFVENSATAVGDSSPTNTDNVTDVSDAGVDGNGAVIANNETVETADGSGATNGDPTDDPTVTLLGVALQARVFLQGALNVPDTYTFTTVMRDALREQDQMPAATIDYLPDVEPYTALPGFTHVGDGGGASVADPGTVFADNGNDSIVDWVFVELRDSADSSVVIATRSALLQRDGDVVDVDGVSPLVFSSVSATSYFVSINHRNHLGVMTENALPLSSLPTTVDFTDPSIALFHLTANADGLEQFQVPDSGGNPTGIQALWAGDVAADGTVVFSGQDNDVDDLFESIDLAPGNIFDSTNFVLLGYHQGDANMNGAAVYAGQNNDTDFIFANIDLHPNNIFSSTNFSIIEQLPTSP